MAQRVLNTGVPTRQRLTLMGSGLIRPAVKESTPMEEVADLMTLRQRGAKVVSQLSAVLARRASFHVGNKA